jgi:hypothetical protein
VCRAACSAPAVWPCTGGVPTAGQSTFLLDGEHDNKLGDASRRIWGRTRARWTSAPPSRWTSVDVRRRRTTTDKTSPSRWRGATASDTPRDVGRGKGRSRRGSGSCRQTGRSNRRISGTSPGADVRGRASPPARRTEAGTFQGPDVYSRQFPSQSNENSPAGTDSTVDQC